MEHELSLREEQSPHKDDGYIYNIDKADPDYKAEGGQVRSVLSASHQLQPV